MENFILAVSILIMTFLFMSFTTNIIIAWNKNYNEFLIRITIATIITCLVLTLIFYGYIS